MLISLVYNYCNIYKYDKVFLNIMIAVSCVFKCDSICPVAKRILWAFPDYKDQRKGQLSYSIAIRISKIANWEYW